MIRYPRPLRSGDTIAVTAPSAGVGEHHRGRLAFCVAWLRERGYEVRLGACLDGTGATSASARARAAELTALLCDPSVAAVVPPWGGELAVEILPHLDFAAIAAADPTWLIGYSDTSTVLVPLTLRTGLATIHGHNLMDTPYRLPDGLTPWHEVAGLSPGASFTQHAARVIRSVAAGFDRWQDGPEIAAATEYTLDEPVAGWSRLDGSAEPLTVGGRLIGGCLETIGPLAGTAYGDLGALAGLGDGLILHVEASVDPAFDAARHLWSLRLAGWFDHAEAVLIGRTRGPAEHGFTQADAARSALGDLDLPVLLDVDCGHVVPALALVQGARATVTWDPASGGRIEQTLV